MTTDDKRWKRVPVAAISQPVEGLVEVYKDRWWAVDKDNQVFLFKGYVPQCNSGKAVVERLKTHPDMVDVVHIPWAYVKVNPSDFN